MKNKWFTYININEKDKYVFTSGISFNGFYEGIYNKPKNILLLKGFPSECSYNKNLCLEYVSESQMHSFIKSDVESFGDFDWIDFENEALLENVTASELAELLYLAHKLEPISKFTYNSLKNKLCYLSHDDGFFAKVYMKNLNDFKPVIEHKILTQLKGRKRSISPLPTDILDTIYDILKQGAVIDFEKSLPTYVNIYTIGSFTSIDNIHRELDNARMRKKGMLLYYDIKKKKWSIL